MFSRHKAHTEVQDFETLLSTNVGHTVRGNQAANNWLFLLLYAESFP
jgi:hypothetical protein